MRDLRLEFEDLKSIEILILLQTLQEALSYEVAFYHRRCVLNKAAENLPSRLIVPLPLDFKLNRVLGLFPVNSMTNNSLDSVPASLLRFFRLSFGTFELKRANLEDLLFLLLLVTFLASLSNWFAQIRDIKL